MSPLIIAVLGDPNSGKSVALNLLYRELAARGLKIIMQEGDVTAPTQPWSLSDDGAKLRKELKAHMDAQKRLAWIMQSLSALRNNKALDVVLVDVGGGRPDLGERVTEWNAAILAHCTHAVIVSRNDSGQIAAWIKELAQKTPHIKIIAWFESVYSPKRIYNFNAANCLWHLDRKAFAENSIPEPTIERIKHLADKITAVVRS